MKVPSIRNYFSSRPYGRAILYVVGGAGTGQMIVLVISPILTRIYTPEDFGLFGLFVSIAGVLGVIASLRYEAAFPLTEDAKETFSLAALCLTSTILLSTACLLAVSIFWPLLSQLPIFEGISDYRWLIPLGVFFIGITNAMNLLSTRLREYKKIALSKISQGISLAVTQLSVGFASPGPVGLIAGDIFGRLAAITHLLQGIGKIPKISLQNVCAVASKFKEFPLLSAPASLFNSLGSRLPILLLASLYGLETAGWFVISQRVVGTPVNLISRSVAQVYGGELGNAVRTSPKNLRTLFMSTSKTLAMGATIPCILLAIVAPTLFALIFGEGWYEAGVYTRYLAFLYAVRLVVVPVSQTLTLLGHQRIQLAWDIVRTILVLLVFLLPATNGISDTDVIRNYCICMASLYLLLWIISYAAIESFDNKRSNGTDA